MPTIRLEVPADRLEQLEAECEMLGFEDPRAYVDWLVENRAAMQGEGGRNRILSAYAKRVRELEERLDAAEGASPDVEPDTEATEAVEEEGTVEVDPGEPGTATGAGSGGEGGERAAAADGGTAANLSPATVRVEDDSVGELADRLQNAQGGRFDEVVRQAVAKTRRQLGEGTDTGVDYDSAAAIRPDGPRPGSEIADLDAVEVPGHDEELIRRRRTAVGAALALLKDRGEARRSEFVEELYGEFPAGYDSVDGWWSCLKRGLRQLDRVDGAGEGSRTWRYRDFTGRVTVVSE